MPGYPEIDDIQSVASEALGDTPLAEEVLVDVIGLRGVDGLNRGVKMESDGARRKDSARIPSLRLVGASVPGADSRMSVHNLTQGA